MNTMRKEQATQKKNWIVAINIYIEMFRANMIKNIARTKHFIHSWNKNKIGKLNMITYSEQLVEI